MLDFVENPHELEKNKMQYCVHKDEMVVGVSRPWEKERVRTLPISAYPRIVSNLGDITTNSKYETPLKMLKYLYHFSTSIQKRKQIIDQMNQRVNTVALHPNVAQHYLSDSAGNRLDTRQYLSKMYDFYPVGVANTLGYAHPNSGDTMSSVMIGGLRTVMNGDFEVYAGDQVQWYWTFETNCFHEDGSRKSICDATGAVHDGGDPEHDYSVAGPQAAQRAYNPRRHYNDLQYGAVNNSKEPADKAKHVARIKPYIRDDDQPRLYDWQRVFGIAISSARPNEMVDIKICRQSM